MSQDGRSGGGDVGKASFALALQHPIALEIQGWDCVSPHEVCMPWGQQSPEQGRGRLPPRIWLYAAAWCPPENAASGGPPAPGNQRGPPRAAMCL